MGEPAHERDDAAIHRRFVEYRRTRDRALRNELVEEHMRLAEFLARRFSHRGEPLDDLRQVALVGLLKAVERFDPHRGLSFSSFATPTISGELKRHFRDRGWAVRVPRRVQELHLQLDRTMATLSQELGRPPTPGEIAERAGVLEEEVLEGMEAGSLYRLASLDGRPDDSGTGYGGKLGEADRELGAIEDRLAVEELLTALPEREQHIVYLRFFEGLTQSEIAERIGISQMHVSRLLAKSLELLRDHAGDGEPELAETLPIETEADDMIPHPEGAMSQTEHREPDPAILATFDAEPGATAGEQRLRVVGEVDVASSPALRAKIAELLDGGADRIVLDLSEMTFIDSSGLGVLVGALKRVRERDRCDLVLTGLQGPPRRVFEITGLTELFSIES